MDFLQVGTGMAYDFASAKAFEEYNRQITALRQTLLGNKTDYTSGNSVTDEPTRQFYNKILVYSTALTVVSIAKSALLEKLNDKKYERQANESSDLIESRKIDAGIIEGNIEDYHDIDVPARKTQLEETKYKNWLDDSTLTNAAIEEKNKKLWENNNKPEEISKELKDSGFESNANTFPKPGEELSTHNTENGIKFINRASFEVFDKGKKETLFKGWSKFGKADPDKYSTPSNPMSEKVSRMLEEYRRAAPGSYKFFIEKLHGKSVDGTFFVKNPIKAGKTREEYPNRMIFPAYIMAFNDSYNASWSDYNFIGRGEKVWIYQNTSRELTIEFYMISDFSVDLLNLAIQEAKLNSNPLITATPGTKWNVKDANLNANSISTAKDLIQNIKGVVSPSDTLDEIKRLLPDWGLGAYPNPSVVNSQFSGFVPGMISGTPEMMWARLTFLAQCVYPWYRKDGKLKEQPFIRIRIGDFIDSIAKINSLTLNEYNEFDIDLNPSVVGAIPMGVRVVLSMTIVHEDEPNTNYNKFYWRKDYDVGDENIAPDNTSETSKTLDFSLDESTGSSEASSSTPGTPGISSKEKDRQKELAEFKSSLKGLSSMTPSITGNTGTQVNTNLVRKSILAAKRFLETKQQADALKLKNVNDEEFLAGSDAVFDNASKIKKAESLPPDTKTSSKKKLFS